MDRSRLITYVVCIMLTFCMAYWDALFLFGKDASYPEWASELPYHFFGAHIIAFCVLVPLVLIPGLMSCCRALLKCVLISPVLVSLFFFWGEAQFIAIVTINYFWMLTFTLSVPAFLVVCAKLILAYLQYKRNMVF